MLLEEFLKPMRISQRAFAERIGVTLARLSEIIHGKRAVTGDTALRLARALGTDAEWWLRMQLAVDLYDLAHSESAKEIQRIKPLPAISAGERSPARRTSPRAARKRRPISRA
jgi:addiction module HigA family antidote